jgi:uncharacterized protein YndB with AHSA1/START domain
MTAKTATATGDGFEVAHASFNIERIYPQSPAKVFRAFQDPQVKRLWFAEGEGFEVHDYTMDFRIGGNEVTHFRFGESGPEMSFVSHYHDIVENRRIVYSYHMTVAGNPLSASLSTIELIAEGKGTRLIFTEQDAFFGGQDSVKSREEGTRELLEKLGEALAKVG